MKKASKSNSPRPSDEDETHRYRYKRLLQATCRLNQEHDVDALLHFLAEAASDLTDADRASVFLTEPAQQDLEARVALKSDLPLRVKAGKGIAGHVCETGQPLIIQDVYSDPRFNPEVDKLTGYTTNNMACVPIRHLYRTPIGVFQVLNRRSGEFSDADIDILLGLGAHAAIALDGVQAWAERERAIDGLTRTKRELTERLGQLDTLYTLETALNEEQDPEQFLQVVIHQLAKVFGVEAASLLLPKQEREVLHFLAASGPASKGIHELELNRDEGIASWVHRNGVPVLCNAPDTDPRYSSRVSDLMGFRTYNILCVPVVAGEIRLGALELCNRIGGEFSEGDLRSAILLGRNLGSGLIKREERLKNQARSRMATLGLLVEGIAHDLKSPLGSILQAVPLLSSQRANPAGIERISGIIDRQTRRCLSLTEDVLDYARGTFAYDIQPVPARQLLDDLQEGVQHEMRNREIQLDVELIDEPTVRADRRRMCRVFTNIVLNAARAIQKKGTIQITVLGKDDEALFAFEDSGPGVPAEVRDQIFEPFVSSYESTGLGLSVCRRIVEDHGGRIWLDVDHSPGACFSVALPMASSTSPASKS